MLGTERTEATPGSGILDLIPVIFVLLAAVIGFVSFATESRPIRLGVSLAVVAIVLASLYTAAPADFRVARWAVAAALLMGVITIAWTSGEAVLRAISALLVAVVLGVSAYRLVRAIFARTEIGSRDIMAALTAYLQVALMFAYLYSAGSAATDDMLNGGSGDAELNELVYFSIVTISTLGYGDITPASSLARSLVMIETITGQIALVVFVAYLVGRLGSAPIRAVDDESA